MKILVRGGRGNFGAGGVEKILVQGGRGNFDAQILKYFFRK